MSKLAIVTFPAKDIRLSTSEKKVVSKLIEAARAITSIYQKQENPKFLGANFYPHDATKSEILQAAKHNPDILSPYTIVEKNNNGKLKEEHYHIKYKNDLERVSRFLRDAAKLSDNKKFASRL